MERAVKVLWNVYDTLVEFEILVNISENVEKLDWLLDKIGPVLELYRSLKADKCSYKLVRSVDKVLKDYRVMLEKIEGPVYWRKINISSQYSRFQKLPPIPPIIERLDTSRRKLDRKGGSHGR